MPQTSHAERPGAEAAEEGVRPSHRVTLDPPLDCAFTTPRYAPGDKALSSLQAAVAILTRSSEPIDSFDDWWEHDGLMFASHFSNVTLQDVLAASPADLAKSAHGDDHVCTGLAPKSRCWYLRFRFESREQAIVGHFDIFADSTFVNLLSAALRSTIAVPVEPLELLAQIRLP
jgi:hypothetical protein